VNDDEDLFAAGLVNSLFAMQLVLFVEKKFSIKVENQDLRYCQFQVSQCHYPVYPTQNLIVEKGTSMYIALTPQ